MTSSRLPWRELAPKAYRALVGVNQSLADSTLGKPLIDLVQLRVSQHNGCAYCVDLHARDLLSQGEDLQRINSLSTWREVPFFSERERAALNWAESLTKVSQTRAPDEDFDALRPHFSEGEIVELSLVIAQMNVWNRMGVGMRIPVAAKRLTAAA